MMGLSLFNLLHLLLSPGGGLRSGSQPKKSAEESSTLRSGRRLDDSVFESGDQNSYEGSLMKLTARPPFVHTTTPVITEDIEMQQVMGKYTKDSLDALKAVQSVIDARRAYAQTLRGPTISPVPTYPFNEVERMAEDQSLRRMMANPNMMPSMNPARLAVPNSQIGSAMNWIAPIRPRQYEEKFKDLGLEHESTTFPSAIPFQSGPLRPTPTRSSLGLYLTKFHPFTLFSTRSTYESEMTLFTKDPKVLSFKEKLMADNDMPISKHRPKPDDDYDYDVKGLPVRKRRSINLESLTIKREVYGLTNRNTNLDTNAVRSKNLEKESNLLENTLPNLLNVNEETVNLEKDNNYIGKVSSKQPNNTLSNVTPTTEMPMKKIKNESRYRNLSNQIRTNLQVMNKNLSESDYAVFDPTLSKTVKYQPHVLGMTKSLLLNKIVFTKNNTNTNYIVSLPQEISGRQEHRNVSCNSILAI